MICGGSEPEPRILRGSRVRRSRVLRLLTSEERTLGAADAARLHPSSSLLQNVSARRPESNSACATRQRNPTRSWQKILTAVIFLVLIGARQPRRARPANANWYTGRP